MTDLASKLDQYAKKSTTRPSAALAQLEKYSQKHPDIAKMQTGRVEGALLKTLVKVSRAKRILEIGTFLGYSALAMAEGLPKTGQLITCEADPRPIPTAKKFWAQSPHGKKIQLKFGPALATIKKLSGKFDLVFVDADKSNYLNYYKALVPKVNRGGLIIIDNVLWGGDVLKPKTNRGKIIDQLNQLIAQDQRVEALMLPIRDGLTIAIKR